MGHAPTVALAVLVRLTCYEDEPPQLSAVACHLLTPYYSRGHLLTISQDSLPGGLVNPVAAIPSHLQKRADQVLSQFLGSLPQ